MQWLFCDQLSSSPDMDLSGVVAAVAGLLPCRVLRARCRYRWLRSVQRLFEFLRLLDLWDELWWMFIIWCNLRRLLILQYGRFRRVCALQRLLVMRDRRGATGRNELARPR